MTGKAVSPRYAFVSPKRLITYVYPLLLSYYISEKYLKIGYGLSTKTKMQNQVKQASKVNRRRLNHPDLTEEQTNPLLPLS
jgi:hypothetical protein